MTLTQLEYILAIDTYRHFNTAAEKCSVTQPSLSMQVRRLEEELGIQIFDRSRVPVVPTEAGASVITQARLVLRESRKITELADMRGNVISGELRIGIIPTLAPYLLPLFLQHFASAYPRVKIRITEAVTEKIISDIKRNELDAGILATPLQDRSIHEEPLFYEQLFAYVSDSHTLYKKKYVLSRDIEPDELFLLEEGHCFRSQIIRLCELKHASVFSNIEYEAGSIETLMRLVERSKGITVIPELATHGLSQEQQLRLKPFLSPGPVREISLVSHRSYVKQKLTAVLKKEILDVIPEKMKKAGRSAVAAL